ncbi:hypothetical protein AQI88_00450 [Streptomyces cellostaticus]|uniref:FAD-binding domain-containing protein n=1 Tax=Streptomyces cellostaticus TaxID=67285 RepID=A0A101NT66_9ACTN|nr:FAD-dependent oxidoreductase [Streptomyces cellostaticus]KUM98764.1 hypothetical protein AQI88_00450 [Streptomyces cellostaticus]GHI03454.1 hypothetical protein Scel_17750 [Streptomyces cellostaticus]
MDVRHLDPGADADVLIAGAGPAGCAAAIVCAAAGLRTVLAERAPGPAARPGEALHPGAETLLARLLPDGFADAVRARHDGITVGWGAPPRFQPFGRDANGPWYGFQADRQRLDALLLERARHAGADVRHGCRVLEPAVRTGAVTGVRLSGAATALRTRTVIDATGRARRLTRSLGLTGPPRSPRLLVRYGYAAGVCPRRDAAPAIVADGSGWTPTARVAPGRYQWMRLDFVPDQTRRLRAGPPDEFAGLRPEGGQGGGCQLAAEPEGGRAGLVRGGRRGGIAGPGVLARRAAGPAVRLDGGLAGRGGPGPGPGGGGGSSLVRVP